MNKRTVSWAVSAVILAIPIIAWVQRYAIFDAWRLRNYSPPAEIVELANATTMTHDSRRLFYVYHPVLEKNKAQFNGYCSEAEQTIVLGCYIEHQGIYLYDVPDERLQGVEEVTAAHEMLHAAYDRLSAAERSRIDKLALDTFEQMADERLQETIDNYRKKDPSVVPNELHSILATEVRELPSELEKHYQRYFTDRLAVVKLAESYRQEFTSRERQVKELDGRLSALRRQIDTLNGSLEQQQTALKAKYDELQRNRESGNTEAYNEGVPTYNQMVIQYNADVNKQRALVTEYNQLVEDRNNLAVEENELIQALDSRSTIETQ